MLTALWGQLSVGLFADGTANYGGLQVKGLFFGDPSQLVAQIIGWCCLLRLCLWYLVGLLSLYKKLFGLRVSAETELKGLDIPEMGSLGYNPDWEPSDIPELTGVSGAALAGTD